MSTSTGNEPERIDVNDKAACESWAHRLNVTHEKLREAVGAVGDDAKAVEKHLKELSETQKGGRGTM
jgi:methyl-accepting chemotaxis protein